MEVLSGTRAELDARAAAIVASAIAEFAAVRPQVVLGVVGGRSVGGIYRHLQSANVPWNKVHVFLADERLVPITSDESNFKLVQNDLLAPLFASGKMPRANAHAFELNAAKPDSGVSDYGATLARLGGRFDVALLSAGEDGHCASLFPGHPSVLNDTDAFVLVEGSPKPPPRRISASRRLLERTEVGLVVFFGEEKRAALAKFRDPAIEVRDCPSKLVSGLSRGYLVTDLS